MRDAKSQLSLGQVLLPRSATEDVLDALRESIGDGTLKPGEQLVQNEIAESLSVSRMPVREALRILEVEGWVEFSPRRGAVVASLSAEDVKQIFEIRFALESLALRQSIPFLTDESYDRANSLLDEMDLERDIGRWVDLHRKFHLTLYSAASARLVELIQAQYAAVERYLRIELVQLNNKDENQQEHRRLLEACSANDIDKAIEVLRVHVEEGGLELSDSLSTGGSGGH